MTADPVQLTRLIRFLLEVHPNSFSLVHSTISAYRSKDTEVVSNSSPPKPIMLEAVAELNRNFGLGLSLENHIEVDVVNGQKQSTEDSHQKVVDFDWVDVLRAYIAFSSDSKSVVPFSSTPTNSSSANNHLPLLPSAIHELIAHVHAHSLSRVPINLPSYDRGRRMVGMSPKKAYEVTRMATYVSQIAKNLRVVDGFYIVDVGAGQGHLARELLDVVTGVKGVLALDGDTVLVKRQASVQHPKPRIGVEHATDETDAADATSVTHKFGHITSPERLVEAVDEWFTEMETGHTLRSNIPKPVMLVSLHGCGSLSLDVLRAFVEKRFRLEDIQRGRRRWGFIASVTVPCCYNLLREGEYPVSAPLSPSYPTASHCRSRNGDWKYFSFLSTNASPSQTLSASKYLLPHPLPPNAYHLAAQVPDSWTDSGSMKTTLTPNSVRDSSSKTKLEIEMAKAALHFTIIPSTSALLAVRKVVWRALLECLFVHKGIKLDDMDASGDNRLKKPGFILPMEANAYIHDNIRSSSSTPSFASTPRAGKIGSNLEQGRLGRLGRFPPRAYDTWTTFLNFAGSRLGVDLRNGSPEKAWTSTSNLTSTSDTTKSSPESINTTLSPTLVPLARALSILYVLRCMLGPLVEAALLEDRVRWVRERLAVEKEAKSTQREEKSNDMRLTYNTLLVPLFSQLGEVGSARNIAVVVIPEYIE